MTSQLDFLPLHLLMARGRSDAHPVVHDGLRYVLWREFSSRVSACVSQLSLRAEMRWLLASNDPLSFAIQFFALLHSGKHLVVPPNTQAGTLATLVGAYDACFDEDELERSESCGDFSVLDPNVPVIDLYTSGSTGEPKRVRKTLAQYAAEVEVLESMWGPQLGSSAIVATVPHQHVYGLLFRLLWPLAAGRAFDAVTCARPDILEERLAVLGDSALISSPAHLSRIPELIPLTSLHPKLKRVFSSGGPLAAASAYPYLQQFGRAPTEVFGSTETGGVAWREQNGADGDDWWTPFPGIKVYRSARGALSLQSPFLAAEAVREMDDGIELGADQRFRLLGRLDRVVKIEEKRLSLPAMEALLNSHPWVATAVVVPLSKRRQTLGVAAVLSAEGQQALVSQTRRVVVQVLRELLHIHFEPVLLPRHWRFPNQLPIDERGKMPHADLVGLFSNDEHTALKPKILAIRRNPEGDHVQLDLLISPSIGHFAGHFPDLPILPGVVQLDWAARYAREYLALSGEFSALENLKFLALVLPEARLQLSLKWDEETKRLDFSYMGGQRKYSQGRIVFCEARAA